MANPREEPCPVRLLTQACPGTIVEHENSATGLCDRCGKLFVWKPQGGLNGPLGMPQLIPIK